MDGLLCSIATMYVRRDELAPNLPLVHSGGIEFGAGFIVEDLEINVVPTVGKVAHDGVVGGQLVCRVKGWQLKTGCVVEDNF